VAPFDVPRCDVPPLKVRLVDTYRQMVVRQQMARNRPAAIWWARRGPICTDQTGRNQLLVRSGGSASRRRNRTLTAVRRRVGRA
jgi:hypothetical protein